MSLLSSSSDFSMEERLVVEAPAENNSSDGTAGSNNNHQLVGKGKRAKRRRLHLTSLVGLASPSPSSSSSSSSSSMTTTPAELPGSATEEEEDMAKCLILLARGQGSETVELKPSYVPREEDRRGAAGGEKVNSRRLAEAATNTATTKGKTDFYLYECRTCNKCFPSFQALGGHRASHKKPKTAAAMTPVQAIEDKKEIEEEYSIHISPPINNNKGANKSRVHECSICGSEFSSGQALGGHMRRHRPITTATQQGSPEEAKKQKIDLLSLDLNLPAPTDDDRCDVFPKTSPANMVTGAFPFGNKQQPLHFTTSALVDCHY